MFAGLKTHTDLIMNPWELPKKWQWQNYIDVFKLLEVKQTNMIGMIGNTLWWVFGATFLSIFSVTLVAYAVTRYRFPGRNVIYAVIIFTMTIPIIGSTGSTLKLLSDLHIYNTPLFLLTACSGFGFNFMILYGFFKSLPWSFAEAVFIDGGSDFTAFFRIMLPQAKSAIFTLVIMAWIGAWNDYTTALLYLPDFPTIASGLYRVQDKAIKSGDIPVYYAGLVLSIIPVIVLFSCCSDTIMKNFTLGGLKG
jgi:ABC-type glycerol-3-phosphate transport system permease component